MLKFFREKAKWICIGIIAFFAITMFAGSSYIGRFLNHEDTPSREDEATAVARVGTLPIGASHYQRFLSQSLSQVPQTEWSKLDPEVMEVLQFSAFQRALNEVLFIKGAKNKNLSVSRSEYNRTLESIYPAYRVKDLSALKDLLKQHQYPYDQFKETIKRDILAQKFITLLQKGITVSTADVYGFYTQTLTQHILLKSALVSSSAQAQLLQLRHRIASGESFEKLASDFSQDELSKTKGGHLPWISLGKASPEFEKIAASLQPGQLSGVFRTPSGYHLLRVLSRKTELPPTFNFTSAKRDALQYYQTRTIRLFINKALMDQPLTLTEPSLKAYYAKHQGDTQTAINAYQAQISSNPAHPVPHYLLAKLYVATQKVDLARQELEKGELKAQLNPAADFMALHLALGSVYGKLNNPIKRKEQFEKALKLAIKSRPMLEYLSKQFKELGDTTMAEKARTEFIGLP